MNRLAFACVAKNVGMLLDATVQDQWVHTANTLDARGEGADSRYCPSCGYDQHGRVVCEGDHCPECGFEICEQSLLDLPPPGPIMRITLHFCRAVALVVVGSIGAFLVLTVLGVGVSFVVACIEAIESYRPPPKAVERLEIEKIAVAYQTYFNAHGHFPAHPMLVGLDGRDKSRVLLRESEVLVWTPEAMLYLAMNENCEPSWFGLGDYQFSTSVAHDSWSHEKAASLILCWGGRDDLGRREVLFCDGRSKRVDADGWLEAWFADRQARGLQSPP